MTSIVNRTPALPTSAQTSRPGARWSDLLPRIAGALQQTVDKMGRQRAAAELLRTAVQYEMTQPSFAAELRRAAGFLKERG